MKFRKKDYIITFFLTYLIVVITVLNINFIVGNRDESIYLSSFFPAFFWSLIIGTITNLIFKKKGLTSDIPAIYISGTKDLQLDTKTINYLPR